MSNALNPWQLPSAQQFVSEIMTVSWQGGAVLALDSSTPPDLPGELTRHIREDRIVQSLIPVAGEMPLHALTKAANCQENMASLVIQEHVLIVDATGLSEQELKPWATFLPRFAQARARLDCGVAILFLAPFRFQAEGFDRKEWSGRLRRIDSVIWAEFHVQGAYSGLLQELAVNLAVELCGWRLDLIADIVTQRTEDILAPSGWLRRNADKACDVEVAYGNRLFSCPIHLFSRGQAREVDRRIWRAQLSAFFPWIEEHRLQIIDQYRRILHVDEHLRALHVGDVENIELGALKFQLKHSISREEAEFIEDLATMRNALAHRRPVDPRCFDRVIRISKISH